MVRMGFLRAVFASILLPGLAPLGSPVWAEEFQGPANLPLLEDLVQQVADEITADLAVPTGAVIRLGPETGHEANWLVADALARALRARGCEVSLLQLGAPRGGVPASGQPAAAPKGAGSRKGEVAGGALGEPELEEGAGLGSEREEPEEGEEGDLQEEDGEAEETGAGQEAGEGSGEAEQQRPRPRRGPHRAAQPKQTGSASEETAEDRSAANEPFELVVPETGKAILFRVLECGVSFPVARRSWLLGPTSYERVARVRVSARYMEEPGHRVLGLAEASRARADTVPGSAMSYVAGPEYPFSMRVAEPKSVKALLQPLIVTGIVSGLVYLFHQNQK